MDNLEFGGGLPIEGYGFATGRFDQETLRTAPECRLFLDDDRSTSGQCLRDYRWFISNVERASIPALMAHSRAWQATSS